MNNPIAIGSSLIERQRIDSNVLNQTENAHSTLNTLLQNNNGINKTGNAPNTTVIENGPSASNNNSNGKAHLPQPWLLQKFEKYLYNSLYKFSIVASYLILSYSSNTLLFLDIQHKYLITRIYTYP